MGLHKSLLACAGLIALATSCAETENVGPEISYGLIRISVVTTGGDLPNGYEVLVGSQRRGVSSNSSLTLTVTPGPAVVELTDVPNNCLVEGSPSVSVDVPRGNTVDASFHVTCSATGFQVSVHTTGDDAPQRYSLEVTGRPSITIPVNYSLVVSRLDPGAYTLRLESPIANCRTTSGEELTVQLPARTVVPVTFEVACAPVVREEKIAYTLDETSADGQGFSSVLVVARPDGTEPHRLGVGKSPSWSPDGRKLAYSSLMCSDYYGYYGSYCVEWVSAIDPETLNSRDLGGGSMPAWSPTGDVVAMVLVDGSIVLVPTNDSNIFRLTLPNALAAEDPAWSPDGEIIAFACHPRGGFSRLCVINRNGTGFRQLTDSTSGSAVHPAWSHDGNTIAFTNVRAQDVVIATMPAAGGAITILAEGFDPAWSRDGTKLIFARSDGLFTMNPDGSNVQRLTTGRHRAPAWRP